MTDKKYKSVPIRSSEITPEHLYLSRRRFMKLAGIAGAGALLAACGVEPGQAPEAGAPTIALPTQTIAPSATPTEAVLYRDDLGDPATSFKDVTTFNNYYEFGLGKEDPARLSAGFTTSPWQVEVGGLVNKPRTFGIEDILKLYPQEDRVYRMRCVEGWSMVIPWMGFPLSALLNEVEPTSDARYVNFVTVNRPEEMPGMKQVFFDWPYLESLRLDEAMNDLTILSTGLYGKQILPQNGAPIRLVVPWKYGFKSGKSIVKIELVQDRPATFWIMAGPNEYGYYANVNPEVDHPRWSQAIERRIGESDRRDTLMFNGYAEEVAHLYDGMDLRINF